MKLFIVIFSLVSVGVWADEAETSGHAKAKAEEKANIERAIATSENPINAVKTHSEVVKAIEAFIEDPSSQNDSNVREKLKELGLEDDQIKEMLSKQKLSRMREIAQKGKKATPQDIAALKKNLGPELKAAGLDAKAIEKLTDRQWLNFGKDFTDLNSSDPAIKKAARISLIQGVSEIGEANLDLKKQIPVNKEASEFGKALIETNNARGLIATATKLPAKLTEDQDLIMAEHKRIAEYHEHVEAIVKGKKEASEASTKFMQNNYGHEGATAWLAERNLSSPLPSEGGQTDWGKVYGAVLPKDKDGNVILKIGNQYAEIPQDRLQATLKTANEINLIKLAGSDTLWKPGSLQEMAKLRDEYVSKKQRIADLETFDADSREGIDNYNSPNLESDISQAKSELGFVWTPASLGAAGTIEPVAKVVITGKVLPAVISAATGKPSAAGSLIKNAQTAFQILRGIMPEAPKTKK